MQTYRELIAKQYPERYEFLEKYVNLIEEYNAKMNLTGFNGDTLWKDGIYESIKYLECVQPREDQRWLDIGSGVGFPCLPYLILHPELKLTIIEPSSKRVNFLEIVAQELKLKLNIIQDRAENCRKFYKFDVVTSRAVSSLRNLLLSTYHLAKTNGKYFYIKGPNYQAEIDEASEIIQELKLKIKPLPIEKIESKKSFVLSFFKRYDHPKGWPWNWSKIISSGKK